MRVGIMRRLISKIFIVIIVITSGFSYCFSQNGQLWEKISAVHLRDIRTLVAEPQNSSLVYIGTSDFLYSFDQDQNKLSLLLQPEGNHQAINDVYINEETPEIILAATDAGLYQSRDRGVTWQKLFFSSDGQQRVCLSVFEKDNIIYLGTEKGLLLRDLRQSTWNELNTKLSLSPIVDLVYDAPYVYIATDHEVFKFDPRTRQNVRIFSLSISSGEDEENLPTSNEGKEHKDYFIKSLLIVNSPHRYIFVASRQGIYYSQDNESQWSRFFPDNLPLDHLTSFIHLRNSYLSHGRCQEGSMDCLNFLAGTTKGVFFYAKGEWVPLDKGMENDEVNFLSQDKQGMVYAAAKQGLYHLSVEKKLPLYPVIGTNAVKHEVLDMQMNYSDFLKKFNQEPSIKEVHQMAIEYAEVNPEKIKSWRKLARLKALMPSFSTGLGRSSSERYHWDTGQNPDFLQEGKDFLDWDVSLTWDFSDLVWSADQTTIDSRSKLMVELRENILDEVTRLYFERRRLQIECVQQSQADSTMVFDKQIRIDELTALIDALTGGEYSQSIINAGVSDRK